MDLSAALIHDLLALTHSLDDPDVDLETELRVLLDAAQAAVPSLIAVQITIVLDGRPISLHASNPNSEDRTRPPFAATSLQIPLTTLADVTTGSLLILYAQTPGALVDLASDLAFALEVDPATLALDAHTDQYLAVTETTDGIGGLNESSLINQAIGVLIHRGHTPETARAQLEQSAHANGGSITSAARAIVASLNHDA